MEELRKNIYEDFLIVQDKIQRIIRIIRLKKLSNLDFIFGEIHEEVFSKTDCLTIVNCCKTSSPMLFDKDIVRLAEHLRIKPGNFIQKYVFMDSDGFFAFQKTPCPFLGANNYSSVYEF